MHIHAKVCTDIINIKVLYYYIDTIRLVLLCRTFYYCVYVDCHCVDTTGPCEFMCT